MWGKVWTPPRNELLAFRADTREQNQTLESGGREVTLTLLLVIWEGLGIVDNSREFCQRTRETLLNLFYFTLFIYLFSIDKVKNKKIDK